MTRWILLGVFAAAVLAQLGVPVSLIVKHERVLRNGTQHRFRCRPVDPADPFRGRYVVLSFTETSAPLGSCTNAVQGRKVFATLAQYTDGSGYSHFTGVSTERPREGEYLAVCVQNIYGSNAALSLPFDRYFMEETMAPEAEAAYREALRSGNQESVYATVRVFKGEAVLEDLYIGETPLREHLKKLPEKK